MGYCRKSETRPDFVAVKGLVEQHTVSYRCSRAPSTVLSTPRPPTFSYVVSSKSDYQLLSLSSVLSIVSLAS